MDRIYPTLLKAAQNAFTDLFAEHNENFYYLTLVMAECSTPFISAWSYEAFERVGNDDNIKWSYADSPYCAYGYDMYFTDVEKLYNETVNFDSDNFEIAVENWLNAMESVMKALDINGIFSAANERDQLFINAEIMPPESDNSERAKRLNPSNVYERYCSEYEAGNDVSPEIDYEKLWHPELCDIVLTSPVKDKATLFQLKMLFTFEGTVTELVNGCKNVPFVLKRDALYKDVLKLLENNSCIAGLVNVSKK